MTLRSLDKRPPRELASQGRSAKDMDISAGAIGWGFWFFLGGVALVIWWVL